jgi:hypothetical protein
VQIVDAAWGLGLPLVVVASSVLVLVSVLRSREASGPVSRPVAALVVFVWLKLAGEAAFGDLRPAFERQWKGAAALLLAAAGAVHLWKYLHRRYGATPEPAAVAHHLPASAVLVTMPALGQDVTEGTVTHWLKRVGDRVEVGEPLVEVSTDKVDTEIPAAASGNLRDIRIPAGGIATVGAVIAVIGPTVAMNGGSR